MECRDKIHFRTLLKLRVVLEYDHVSTYIFDNGFPEVNIGVIGTDVNKKLLRLENLI